MFAHKMNEVNSVINPVTKVSFKLFFAAKEDITQMIEKIAVNIKIQANSARQIFILFESDDLLDNVFFVTPLFFGVFLKKTLI